MDNKLNQALNTTLLFPKAFKKPTNSKFSNKFSADVSNQKWRNNDKYE